MLEKGGVVITRTHANDSIVRKKRYNNTKIIDPGVRDGCVDPWDLRG